MNAGPNEEDIISALQQSGYLMEQEVASELEALGYHVFTNWPFEDSDEGKSREVDVRAIRRFAHNETKKVSAFVEIIVECKNGTNPIVFVERPKNEPDRSRVPTELVFPISTYTASKRIDAHRTLSRPHPAFQHLGFHRVHYDARTDVKAVQFCRIDRKGSGWHANHGGLYDAIFYPMAKVITKRLADIRKITGDRKYFWFLFPLIVVSGDLFSVDSTNPNTKPAARKFVTFKRELRARNLEGYFSLDFVQRDYLKNFISECVNPLADHAAQLANENADFVLNAMVPWKE